MEDRPALYAPEWFLDRPALEENTLSLRILSATPKKQSQFLLLQIELVLKLVEVGEPLARLGEAAELVHARLLQVCRLQPGPPILTLFALKFADRVHRRERNQLDLGFSRGEGLGGLTVYRRAHDDQFAVQNEINSTTRPSTITNKTSSRDSPRQQRVLLDVGEVGLVSPPSWPSQASALTGGRTRSRREQRRAPPSRGYRRAKRIGPGADPQIFSFSSACSRIT